MPWEERAAIFLRAAELLAGPWRDTLNAATMLGQSKTAHQAEIDAACELTDFWRFNRGCMTRIYEEQPMSSPGVWNRMEYRPLEGFVFAVTPFNFTAIGGNLPTAPGAHGQHGRLEAGGTAMLSAYYVMRLLQEAGLPPTASSTSSTGPGAEIGNAALASRDLAGVHFTGSTPVFQSMWKTIGDNIAALPQLSAHRRRDRRQGLHRRAPVRERGRGRHGDRARLLRVPGPEVLGRFARLRAGEPVAGAARAARRGGRVESGWATSPTSRTSWARSSTQGARDAPGGDRGGARATRNRDRRRRRRRRHARATSSSRR